MLLLLLPWVRRTLFQRELFTDTKGTWELPLSLFSPPELWAVALPSLLHAQGQY